MAAPRHAAVAGRFYPGDPGELRDTVSTLFDGIEAKPEPARAVMLPHAGYVFSGRTAAMALARVVVPRRVIVACPNHTGRGSSVSLWPGGAWELPCGSVPVDEELMAKLLERSPLEADSAAHVREHAVEVQLPLLMHCQPELRLTALCLGGLSFEECAELGHAIAEVVRDVERHGDSVLLVASTDMSHYIPAAEARRLDDLALGRYKALDPEGLFHTVRRERITMCGIVPTTTLLVAAVDLGAQCAELVHYTNSGERLRDYQEVVGYASGIVRLS